MFFQKQYEILDGRVAFVMYSRPVYAVELKLDELDSVLPDSIHMKAANRAAIYWYKQCLASTVSIAFKLTPEDAEQHPEWAAFEAWWQIYNSEADPRKTWRAFVTFANPTILWNWQRAYEGTKEVLPTAPVTLHPGAEERAKGDPDFLAGSKPTSKAGGNSSGKSRKRKERVTQKLSG